MNITVKTQSGSVAGQVIFEEKEKKTLLELLREDQIYLDAPCNGNGSCGKCLVQYEKGSTKVTAAEQETLSAAQLPAGLPACLSVRATERCSGCIAKLRRDGSADKVYRG